MFIDSRFRLDRNINTELPLASQDAYEDCEDSESISRGRCTRTRTEVTIRVTALITLHEHRVIGTREKVRIPVKTLDREDARSSFSLLFSFYTTYLESRVLEARRRSDEEVPPTRRVPHLASATRTCRIFGNFVESPRMCDFFHSRESSSVLGETFRLRARAETTQRVAIHPYFHVLCVISLSVSCDSALFSAAPNSRISLHSTKFTAAASVAAKYCCNSFKKKQKKKIKI